MVAVKCRELDDAVVGLCLVKARKREWSRDDHPDLVVRKERIDRVGVRVGVDALVVDRHRPQEFEGLLVLGSVKRCGLTVGGDVLAALLPDHWPEAPDGVFVTRHRVHGPKDLLRGVRELLRCGAIVVPRPIRAGWCDARLLEDGLVVDHREVVDERRECDHAPADGCHLALGSVEVVPAELRVVDDLCQLDEFVASRERRCVGTEDVGDVRVVVCREHRREFGEDLVSRRALLGLDRDIRVFGFKRVGDLTKCLRGDVDVCVPDGDCDRRLWSCARSGNASGARGVATAAATACDRDERRGQSDQERRPRDES